ncbi:unnamed protein product [Closterium sp. NIES-65]|nr:unnamed protein product [Closterium sp. NIES-65]
MTYTFLQLTAKEDISLYDHALGHATAPAATADSTARSQWQTRDAHARFAIRNSLPIDEREHFGQHKTAQALYTAVVARYSSPGLCRSWPGVLPPPFFPLSPLLLLSTSLVLRRSGLRAASSGRRSGKGKGGKAVVVTAGVAVVGEVVAGGVARWGRGQRWWWGGGSGGGGGRGGGGGGGGGGRGAGRGWGGRGVVAGVVVEEALAVARDSSTLRRPRRSVSGTLSTGGGGGLSCTYVIRTGDRTGQPCGGPHATQRCLRSSERRLACSVPQATELPRWVDLLKKGIDIYALDFDAILSAMYVMSTSGEGSEYLSVPPDPGIRTSASAAPGTHVSATPGAGEAAALGACVSAPPGMVSTAALHTFTLDSGLHLPSFSTNLVAGCALQDGGVHQFTPAYERVTHCTCARTGRHLATFTRQPGSDLYTLTTASPQVATSASAFASASGQLSAPCSCRSLVHETVLWHHRLGHPSVQRLRAMHSRYLVSGLPRVLPPLPPSPAPPCLPCVEGAARRSSLLLVSPTTAPLQTLHMDVWGPARVRGQGQERYFLIVVDDYSRYTTVFPLRTKGEVPDVLIPRIRRARLQLSERFRSDFPVLRLHSDRGGEFSSDLLAAYCAEHGIEQSFTLPASPQQNGVAERRIGLVMEVARTSLIHAAAPHFLWPFAVRYAAHQFNLWPRVSLPETSPTLLWTGEVGDASRFRVWGSRAFVRDSSADKLSSRAVPCVFLGFVPDAPGWQFYHAASRRVLPSQDVTFDESVPYYRLFPYRTAPLPPPPLFLAPGAAVVDPLPLRVPLPQVCLR